MLETLWSVEINAKTRNLWAFKQFTERLACTAEEYGIAVGVRSEAWTGQERPRCGSTGRTTRHGDTLICPCGFEGNADLTASETLLKRHTEQAGRWYGPCGSSGTTTSGRSHHALSKGQLPKNSA